MKKIEFVVSIIVVLFCTIIGSYGIINAPESDLAELEQELARNERALLQADSGPNIPGQPKQATTTPGQSPSPTEEPEEMISVIGDSVFLGAAPAFQKLQNNVVIDAKVSRQVYQGLDAAKKLNKKISSEIL